MRNQINKLTSLAAFALVLGMASTGFASSVYGKVTFVGTIGEYVSSGTYSPQFRVHLPAASCDGSAAQDRWLVVVGGRSDGIYSHNNTNTRNAYSTLVAAFLGGKNIQIDSSNISCSSTAAQTIYLWTSQIGIY
jgi:hypothetical protein